MISYCSITDAAQVQCGRATMAAKEAAHYLAKYLSGTFQVLVRYLTDTCQVLAMYLPGFFRNVLDMSWPSKVDAVQLPS